MSEPRLRPVPLDEWSEQTKSAVLIGVPQQLVDGYLATGADRKPVPNVLGTLAHHPKLAKRILAANWALLYGGALADRLRELMILRVAWRTRSTYEWVQHANMADRYDITRAEVEAIADGSAARYWTPLEAALLDATDQLLDDYTISDDTWSQLAKELDERQLVEVTFVIGTYLCLAMAFNTFGLQLDADLRDVDVPALPGGQQ